MELGRTPYDLLERESELVSRYNIEFGGFGFTLLFLREYSGFFWILGLFSFLFGSRFLIGLFLFLFLVTIRAVLPRLKFVQVLKFSWGVLNLFIFILIRIFN
jgi:NADH:ubiquinone oxidoreductase subunit H|tara:strand:- start:231 stop:536 length:306 start_codon:yes stop_codon:yes gene_type:complete